MFGVNIDRNAAAVVLHGHRVAVLVQRHGDRVGVAVEVFVDGVIDDFPDEVVQPLGIDAADVHRRPLAHRLQAFEDGDVLGGIGCCAHRFSLLPNQAKISATVMRHPGTAGSASAVSPRRQVIGCAGSAAR